MDPGLGVGAGVGGIVALRALVTSEEEQQAERSYPHGLGDATPVPFANPRNDDAAVGSRLQIVGDSLQVVPVVGTAGLWYVPDGARSTDPRGLVPGSTLSWRPRAARAGT